ncbi:MAG: creatininase family protein [Candidatus Bathyarchaeia archaeon]
MKYRLWDMSWREAEEAFKRSETVILPVGTLHAHGPTPISIDASSVETLADEVGKKTGLLVLPVLPYGENEKMMNYPGTIAISPSTLEDFYVDICRSLRRNGVRKIIFLNGHGGNREILIRSGRRVKEMGILVAIVDWWVIGPKVTPDLFPNPDVFMEELAVAIAIEGSQIADLRTGGYKGEWGVNPTRKVFGEILRPKRFNDFDYRGAKIIVPVDAWDIDLECPPEIRREELESLGKRGHEIIGRLAEFIAEFARDFDKIAIPQSMKPRDGLKRPHDA